MGTKVNSNVTQKAAKSPGLNMIQQGLIDEVNTLLANGYSGNEKPLQSIGYKESIRFIQDSDYNQDMMIEDINISTRQLAKAQRTWFKKWEKNLYHPIHDKDKIMKDFEVFLKA